MHPTAMRRLFIFILFGVALLSLLHLTGAEEMTGEEAEASRDKRNVPNWALTSSDFFGWVEELRSHAGYEKIEDLARTFWAHFPSASRLGYGTEEPEE